jgi:hypothetical protein
MLQPAFETPLLENGFAEMLVNEGLVLATLLFGFLLEITNNVSV